VSRTSAFQCPVGPPCPLIFNSLSSGSPYLVTGTAYDRTADTYSCRDNGVYLFTWSVGVAANTRASVSLQRARSGIVTGVWTLDRLATNYDGVDTISKTVLVNCLVGDTINLILNAGSVFSSQHMLTSFSGFMYLAEQGRNIAWGVYANEDYDVTSNTRLVLQDIEVNEGGAFNTATNEVIVPLDGTYFVYVSAGVQQGRYVTLNVRKGLEQQFSVVHSQFTQNNADHVGNGMILTLKTNDRLHVDIMQGSYVRAGQKATSFIGLYLY